MNLLVDYLNKKLFMNVIIFRAVKEIKQQQYQCYTYTPRTVRDKHILSIPRIML